MTSCDELNQILILDQTLLNKLAEHSAERLHGYVYQLVLDENATNDVFQESVLQMLKILKKLKHTERFVPWLYNIALNNTRRYHCTQKRQDKIAGAYLKTKSDSETSLEQMIIKCFLYRRTSRNLHT